MPPPHLNSAVWPPSKFAAMKTLLAATTIALTLAVTARAQGPVPPGPGGPGGPFSGHEFGPPPPPGFFPDGPGAPHFHHRPHAPIVIPPDARPLPPPMPPGPPPPRYRPPFAGFLRFVFER